MLLLFQSSSNARVEQEIIKWVNDKLLFQIFYAFSGYLNFNSFVLIYRLLYNKHTNLIIKFFLQSSSNARVEQEIIKWVNDKLVESGKSESKINSFQDSKIATARPIIDLIDAIKPGVINYELLQENGGTYEVSSFSKQYEIIRCILNLILRFSFF